MTVHHVSLDVVLGAYKDPFTAPSHLLDCFAFIDRVLEAQKRDSLSTNWSCLI